MTQYSTVFGSLADYAKGGVQIVDDDPKYYAFSNIFEVASQAQPYEKVAVGKNLEYVLEAIRAEGTSGVAGHPARRVRPGDGRQRAHRDARPRRRSWSTQVPAGR